MKHGAKRRMTATQRTMMKTFFIIVPVFMLILLPPLLPHTVSQEPSTEAGNEVGRVRTMLLLIHDKGTLTGAVRVKTDTSTLSVSIKGYPHQTEVIFGTTVGTLQECYASEGGKAGEYLAAVTGETYGSVLRLSTEAVGRLAAELGGGIRYTVPETVGLLSVGEHWLTARQIAELLCYTGWKEPLHGQAAAHVGVIATLLNRYLSPERDLQAAFHALVAVCDDRLTVAQFTVLQSELRRLAAANGGDLCETAVASGRQIGVDGKKRYVLTE